MKSLPEVNCVLNALSAADRNALRPFLQPVNLPFRHKLQVRRRPIETIYFPVSGVASVVAMGRTREQSEVGIIGREGLTGMTAILGVDQSPFDVFMQLEGHGFAIGVDDLRNAMQRSRDLRDVLMRSAYCFMVQVAFTTLANSKASLEQRLARWLLMTDDRITGNEVLLTHEFLSLMLGVRRAGVTIALNHLSALGLIEMARKSVTIRDREGLRQICFGFYGEPEEEFRRMFSDGRLEPISMGLMEEGRAAVKTGS